MRSRVPSCLALRDTARVFAFAAAAAVAGLGCSRADSAADRHLAEMQEAITKVQADQDRMSQLGLLEGASTDETIARPAPRKAPAGAPPRTVQIGDTDAAGESDDPNDPNARPEIRLQGSGSAPSRPLRGKTARGRSGEREEMRIQPSDDDGASRPSIMDPEAKRSYDSALSLVHAKQYDRALEALAGFLVRWPDHPYAENALYWRGEVYFARGEYLRAAEQFEAVLSRFGGGAKAPDALLAIGRCHDRLGASERAKEYWDRLRREYPRSDAAKKIPESAADSRQRGVGPKESR